MAGRISRIVVGLGTVIRDVGSSMRGLMPPLRSPDGTFGTQRMQSQDRAAQRSRRYPGS